MSNHKKDMGRTRKHVNNPINLTFRSKFKVVSGSWMYATHRLMVIHPCAKYGKPMSNHKKVMGRTRICTDRRTEWFLYTSLNFVRGGYNDNHSLTLMSSINQSRGSVKPNHSFMMVLKIWKSILLSPKLFLIWIIGTINKILYTNLKNSSQLRNSIKPAKKPRVSTFQWSACADKSVCSQRSKWP